MIKPAQLYREEVTKKYIETWYDPEYMYYSGWFGNGSLNIPDDNYESHHFVSIHNDEIIGYITYSVSFVTMSLHASKRLGVGTEQNLYLKYF